MFLTRTKLSSLIPFSLPTMSELTLPIYQAPTSQVCLKPYALTLMSPSFQTVSSESPWHFLNSFCLAHKAPSPCPSLGRSPLLLTSSRGLSNETPETKCATPSSRRQELHRRPLRTTAASTPCWQAGLLWHSLFPPAICLARSGNCSVTNHFFLLRGIRQKKSLVKLLVVKQQEERNVIAI